MALKLVRFELDVMTDEALVSEIMTRVREALAGHRTPKRLADSLEMRRVEDVAPAGVEAVARQVADTWFVAELLRARGIVAGVAYPEHVIVGAGPSHTWHFGTANGRWDGDLMRDADGEPEIYARDIAPLDAPSEAVAAAIAKVVNK